MRIVRIAIATGMMVAFASSIAQAASPMPTPSPVAGPPPRILQLDLKGVVDPFIADYVKSGISSAAHSGAEAVLLTIDTPGGLSSSMREITQSILASPVPVICFVYPEGARAASAGTFIMMSCPVAAMAPGTNIGAAHPVGVSGAIESAKVTNDAVASIRSLAAVHGRNADWAASAVRSSTSIPADEALRINVIDVVAPSIPALLQDVDGMQVKVMDGQTVTLNTAPDASIEPRSMGLGANIVHSLLTPDFAFIFFFVGIILIIIELLHPGVSVPGILGIVFIVSAFVMFAELPVQVIGVALLIASALFFFLELKHPGLGAATVGGVICLVLGGLLLFDPSVPNARVSPWLIALVAVLVVAFLATVVQAALKARAMPPRPGLERMIGMEAKVVQQLDPTGVVHVGAENWTASVPAGRVPRGRTVRITGVDGLRLTVEPAEVAPSTPSHTDQKGTE